MNKIYELHFENMQRLYIWRCSVRVSLMILLFSSILLTLVTGQVFSKSHASMLVTGNKSIFAFPLTKYITRYIFFRLLLRIRMGKRKRDVYLKKMRISPIDFLPERPYAMKNGIKAIPRKGTKDFSMLFVTWEQDIG
jgi:hypothetical protein